MPLKTSILLTKVILNTIILVRFLCVSGLWELRHIHVWAGFAVNLALPSIRRDVPTLFNPNLRLVSSLVGALYLPALDVIRVW